MIKIKSEKIDINELTERIETIVNDFEKIDKEIFLQKYIKKDQDILRPGSIFYHYKNLKPYVILGSCKIQEHDIWVEALLYTDLEIYKQATNKCKVEKFVRTFQEFKSKFKKLGVIK